MPFERGNDRTRLLVFAKGPQPGHVKTRLAPLLGADGAAALHARLVERTLSVACNARLGPVELHAAPSDDPFLRACAGRYGACLIGQTPGDLGTRMRNALIEALRVSASANLIGTDCPAITAAHLERAAHAIADGKDAVVVPVEDGGYALIGVRRVDGRLF